MEWRDEAIILGLRRHGETSVILDVMTRLHGRMAGMVRGGRSRRQAPVLQPGNSVEIVWRARLEEHLGTLTVEPLTLRAAGLLESAAALHALNTLTAHLRLLPEREAHQPLFQAFEIILGHLQEPLTTLALLARFELALLGELGFGLDLTECAATGSREDLTYVSPKSGRAVCRAAGEPYKTRLLPLPEFMKVGETHGGVDPATVSEALHLTGYFLERHVLEPRGIAMPPGRAALINLCRI